MKSPAACLAFACLALFSRALDPVAPLGDRMSMEEVGLTETGFSDAAGTDRSAPEGIHDEATGAVIDPGAEKAGVIGCYMHPPYRKGPGPAWQRFRVTLPESPGATLRGLTALRAGAEKSDGVTFSLWVDDTPAWSEHRPSLDWTPFSVDLSRWAGKTVTLRFEVTPGPANDTSFDWAMWGAREILLPGREAAASARAPIPLPLDNLTSRQNGSWAPLSGFAGTNSVYHSGDDVSLVYDGPEGRLAYTWSPGPHGAGAIHLEAQMTDGPPVRLPASQQADILWTREVTLGPPAWAGDQNVVTCRRMVTSADGATATLATRVRIEAKTLVVETSCDQPWIREISPGRWGPVAFRRPVPVPYASHPVEYLPVENLFVTTFPDWAFSNASRFQRERAIYAPLTDGTRNPVRERSLFTAAWHFAEVLPNIPNPPSPHRLEMAGRLVFDLWFGHPFVDTAKRFDALAKLGVRDGFVILHNWQRDGYDNGLPAHWPANQKLGGDDGLALLSATARRHGHRFALHENYVDYYPNYEHFSRADISTTSDGGMEKAWYNSGTGIQSFAVKPSAMLRLARGQSPEIHRRYATDASFVDVKSCVPPWFHVDFEPGLPDAGSMQSVIAAHRALWTHGREVHGGPMTGEGNLHWFWSGWLDGVEAQFGTGWGHNSGRLAPLLVDFNLLRIHPQQINHGQGYLDRWLEEQRPWGSGAVPMIVLDQYRMQQAVFGHGAFVGGLDPGRVWLEQNLMAPLARAHASARLLDLRYQVGGEWMDSTAAVKAVLSRGGFAGALQRVRVTYDNGLVITANGEAGDLVEDGVILPDFGWYARGAGLEGGTVRRDGVVVDYLLTEQTRFANARRLGDWKPADAALPVRVTMKSFAASGGGVVHFSYEWQAGAGIPADVMCFVHVDNPGASPGHPPFLLQQDHRLAKPPGEWRAGDVLEDGPFELRVPAGTPDGRYPWHIGLWNSAGRLPLEGADDGQRRIRLGDLVVAESGRAVRFEPFTPPVAVCADWNLRHLNVEEKEIDFGFVRTRSSVRQERQGADWRTLVYPELQADDGPRER